MKLITTALLLVLLPFTALAEIPPETRWNDPSHVVLDVEFPGDGYHANWELFRCKCGDLLVHSELNVPGEAEKGETLMVHRRAVLSRGFGEHQEELGSSMDAPALMMQLALRLLERAEPGGPAKVTSDLGVDVTEEIMNIMLDTGTAAGGFQAPWSVKGMLAASSDSKRRFDLQFTFSVRDDNGEQEVGMRLKGVADFAQTEFPVAGSEALEGWTLHWRDEADPVAITAKDAKTLDELRAFITDG
ncbi:MAG: hypothetical protein V2I48_15010 [Xanthomonadales bacterium]|jgi:hypothetical protein|nr:hypothetical protein [Xanthomonadales bacterium]